MFPNLAHFACIQFKPTTPECFLCQSALIRKGSNNPDYMGGFGVLILGIWHNFVEAEKLAFNCNYQVSKKNDLCLKGSCSLNV